ncbi:MAG: DUF2304 domain-containing protein [Anaerolineales bacterium]
MTPIQWLLILVAAAIVVVYFNRLRTRLLDRLIFFVLAVVAIALVVQPEWANELAHYLGVGRGADLLVYVGFSGLAFLWLGLYTRQREMDVRLTDLARRIALLQAEKPKGKRKRR